MSSQIDASKKKSKPIQCVVTSDKMDKSRVGTVHRLVKDERYLKYIKQKTKVMFHDANNETKAGDVVLVAPSRPRSSRKKFELLKILESEGAK